MEDKPGPEDTVVHSGDVQVIAETELLEVLEDASIDYSDDGMSAGFTIDAPNTPPPG